MRKKLIGAFLGAMLAFGAGIFHPPPAFAETVEADGEYIMGDGTEENQVVAKRRAHQDALRKAGESVCVLVETFAESIDGELTRDEIRTISAAVLKVLDSHVRPTVEGETVKFICHVIVTVERDNVLDYIRQNKGQLGVQTRQMQEVLAENERLKAEIERLKSEFKTANETDRKRLKEEVKKNERDFEVADLLEQATALIYRRDYDGAEQFIRQALKIEPKNAMAWNRLGTVYNSRSNYNKAVECLDKAVQIDSNYADAWNSLGNVYSNMGNTEKAAECYKKSLAASKKAVNVDPGKAKSWGELAISYMNASTVYGNPLENYDEPIEYFRKALELDPNDKEILANFGYLYYLKDDYDEAIKYAQKAIAVDANYPLPWNVLGYTYSSLENYDKAIVNFTKALSFSPFHSSALIYRSRGECYKARGDIKKSQDDFIKAKQLGWEN